MLDMVDLCKCGNYHVEIYVISVSHFNSIQSSIVSSLVDVPILITMIPYIYSYYVPILFVFTRQV